MILDAQATMDKFLATQGGNANGGALSVLGNGPSAVAPQEVTLEEAQFQVRDADERAHPTGTGYGMADVPDLKQLVLNRIKLLGPVEAGVYFGKSVKVIKSWADGTSGPTIADLQKCLQRPATVQDRSAINLLSHLDIPEGNFVVSQEHPRTPVQILICSKGDIPLPVAVSWVALALKNGPFFRWSGDSLLVHGRNRLADAFLKTSMEWALTLDSDVVPPLGSPWFAEVTGGGKLSLSALEADLIPRLLSHHKEAVGGMYASRERGQPLVTQPDMEPKSPEDVEFSNAARNGNATGLRQVKWLAAGCCLLHRSVFERVRDRFKDELNVADNEIFPYYTPLKNEGEDVAFSNRVAACGIPMFLDPQLVLGHLGRQFFMPDATLPARRLG